MAGWTLALAMAALPLLAGAAAATEAARERPAAATTAAAAGAPRRDPVGPWEAKRIAWAHEALAAERYDAALEALEEIKRRPRLNERERALMWQTFAYVYSAREEYAAAAAAFEHCLQANGLDRSATMQTRYNLAQIYVLLERYDDAIGEFSEWFAQAPNPSGAAYYMYAMAYVQKGDKPAALKLARRAVEVGGADVREPWLQLVSAILLEQKAVAQAVPWLQQLVEKFPKKTYWLQLSAAYSELGQPDLALAVLELAHRQGALDQPGELLTLAQLYLYNQIPLRAAEVVEQGMHGGTIEPSARAYQLLADSLLAARERERAMPALARAAELSESGNGYLRIAQLEFEREQWPAARAALQSAIEKGNLTSAGHAYLLLGIVSANERRWDEAERAFASAQTYEAVETVAAHWLRHLDSQRGLVGEGGSRVAAGVRDGGAAGAQPPG